MRTRYLALLLLLLLFGCSGTVKYSIGVGNEEVKIKCYVKKPFIHIESSRGRHFAINMDYISKCEICKTPYNLHYIYIHTKHGLTHYVCGDKRSLMKVNRIIVRYLRNKRE